MKFGTVPEVAIAARPWAPVQEIGPPPGQEDRISTLEAQIEPPQTNDWGVNIFRFFLELEPGDLEAIQNGAPIEFSVLSSQMVPVAIRVWK